MKPYKLPRILIAAPKSGSGKTLITCGLLEILKRRSLNPIACKCGPDYIDPMFHKYVLGISGANLDTFFLEADKVRELLFARAQSENAGIAVLEGVMGYYDGIGGTTTSASSWEVAAATDTPAVLVLDCKGASLSVAAMAAGFIHFRENSRIEGIILNRVSGMLYERIAAVIESETGIPVLGYLPESAEYQLESRHLGLFLPGEIDRLRERIGALADQMEKSIDIERLLELAGTAALTGETGQTEETEVFRSVRIGVARDESFCFYYQENLELMERMGAELIFFSPLHDGSIPEEIDGLLFGGGYPENYAKELSENRSMRESVSRAAKKGMPFLAECGGFLYLHETLEGSDGNFYPMAVVYELNAYRTERLGRFGYINLTAPDGTVIKGHEFHYWESSDPGQDWLAEKPMAQENRIAAENRIVQSNLECAAHPVRARGRSWRCMHADGAQIGGFPHLYYPSNPEFISGWLSACLEWKYNEERAD